MEFEADWKDDIDVGIGANYGGVNNGVAAPQAGLSLYVISKPASAQEFGVNPSDRKLHCMAALPNGIENVSEEGMTLKLVV